MYLQLRSGRPSASLRAPVAAAYSARKGKAFTAFPPGKKIYNNGLEVFRGGIIVLAALRFMKFMIWIRSCSQEMETEKRSKEISASWGRLSLFFPFEVEG